MNHKLFILIEASMKNVMIVLKHTNAELRLKNIIRKINGRKEVWQLFQQCLELALGSNS